MISVCFAVLFAQQVFTPHSASTLPEREKAAIRDASGTYWRSVDGTNIWLLPLVSWDMNPAGRPRPLTNWTRLVGRGSPYGSNVLVFQDVGRQPRVALLSNLPPESARSPRVNAYAVVRGQTTVRPPGGTPTTVPLYDYGTSIEPPGRTNAAWVSGGTNSVRRVDPRSPTGRPSRSTTAR